VLPNTFIRFIAANFCLCVSEEYTFVVVEVVDIEGAVVLSTGEDVQRIEESPISTMVIFGEEYSLFIILNLSPPAATRAFNCYEAWH
jgi:hypothetical protein